MGGPASFFRARASAAALRRVFHILAWTAAFFAAFALIGFVAVPLIAKPHLEERLSQALHRRVTIESLAVNPFAPSMRVRGLAVRERQGDGLFAGFDELYVNAGWRSIFYLATVVDEVTLVKPRLRVVRNPDRSYNFQDLLDELLAKPRSDGPPAKFAVFNIRVVDGALAFEDRAEGASHAVSGLRVGIPFLSSLPADAEIKVLPELSATVDGARFVLAGDTLPFSDTRTTRLRLDLDGLDLTRLMTYLPFEPRAKLRSALLDARLVLSFEQPVGKPPQVKLRGSTAVRDFALLERDERPVLAWERLGIELNEAEPLAPRLDLAKVELDGAELELRREANGTVNLAELGPATRAAAKEEGAASTPLALKIDNVALRFRKIAFTDETVRPAFKTALEEAQLGGSGLDLEKGVRSEWSFSAREEKGASLKLAAGFTPATGSAPLAVDGRFDASGIQLRGYEPYIRRAADVRIDQGSLDLGLAFQWAGQAMKLDDSSLALHALRARRPDEKEPFIRLRSLEIRRAAADLGAQAVNLGEIRIDDIAARLRRGKDGVLDVTQLAPAAEGESRPPARPWRIDLAHAVLERGALTFEDLVPEEPMKIAIVPFRLEAQRLSTAKGQGGSVSLRATIDKTGTLTASGRLALEPLSARLKVAARSVALLPLQRYLDESVHFAITSGVLSTNGTLAFDLPPGAAAKVAYQGELGIADFASIDKRSTQDLLNWKTLALSGLDFELQPVKLSVDEVALAEYYARIIVSPEGRFNLQDLVAAPQRPAAETSSARPALRIGKIALQGGNVNFSDFFIKPNYRANLTGVGGTVTEMTPDKAGDVELHGKVDNAAPLEIAGRVNPLAQDLFLDLKGSAKDIELPPLSPYAVKYAGYGIERGKLSLKVEYRVEQRKLAAQNQVYLDQLTFGERVDSPTATKLPVTLAVALLKDRNGVIDVSLPISGSLDDPQFSLGGAIAKVVLNLVVKAVTAPFALLGSLFGGGAELAYLEFPSGSAMLPHEPSKLEALAKALQQRPGLKLEISGRAAPQVDREGLKRAALDRKVKAQKWNDLRRGGSAPASVDAVTVDGAEYEKYLRRAYDEEKFAKPRNWLGIARELPIGEMESLMLEHVSVTDEDLRQLANARAQAAKEWLVTAGQVPAQRVFLVAPKLTAEGIQDKGPPTRADFSLK